MEKSSMTSSDLTEFLDAAHLTRYVASEFPQRGGIMLVGPPASLKTSIISEALCHYPDALVLSDLNIKTLSPLREDFISGRFSTIAFKEFSKLYERKADTAKNMEGHLRALVDEGLTRMSFEDQRTGSISARSLVIGALTFEFYGRHFAYWKESGFARRFLWLMYSMRDYKVIPDAIQARKPLRLNTIERRKPPHNRLIRDYCTAEDLERVREMVSWQSSEDTGQILLQKIVSVLKWKYENGDKEKPYKLLKAIEPALTSGTCWMEVK
jgi:hypothetical protein